MTPKEYLMQYRHLDARIDAKLERITRLRALSERRTQTISDMPRGGAGDRYDIVARIIHEEHELDKQLDWLLDLQSEIEQVIATVPDETCRTLLEQRYLTRKTWEQIAESMECDEVTAWRIHGRALKNISVSA